MLGENKKQLELGRCIGPTWRATPSAKAERLGGRWKGFPPRNGKVGCEGGYTRPSLTRGLAVV